MAGSSEIRNPQGRSDPLSGEEAELYARAARAAGALGVAANLESGTFVLTGAGKSFGLACMQRAATLPAFRQRIAATDRDALDGLAREGRLDIRIRLVGEDASVRHVRLTGTGDGRTWSGLLLSAGREPDGGQARLDFEDALRDGLKQGGILAFHQPIVDLTTGRLAGFEALARWRKPGEGLIGPDDFLPLAAEMGLTGEIGDAVRAGAIADLAAWRSARPGLKSLYVAANATAGELTRPGFAPDLIETVRNAGLPRGAFKLEINETEVMGDPEAVGAVCTELKAAGITLVLDDFGTGYSSLARLDRLPFDVLKIDQYFIRAMMADAATRAIVSSVVKLARNYAMLVVAEGVETRAMAEMAREQGCDFAQGYFYASALSPEQADTVIETGCEGRFSGAV